ncbi:class E sortase [Saccharopolyspora griseoalba]|uniref:Class E sortase n=1 Tax=Saccharopolyspora griseoalba TaxID=1431848 RepID=A0ABW2LL18_9PSEU
MVSTIGTPQSPPPDSERRVTWRGVARFGGELMITAGLVLLLFVFYAVYVTDWFAARQQHAAAQQLHDRWQQQRAEQPSGGTIPEPPPPEPGAGFARLHLPALGPGLDFTVLEGTGTETLKRGPGHYEGTQWPGAPGNFAVAGHRIGRGAPFNELDQLSSCDPLVVETAARWYVYRVLPMPEEEAGWDGRGGDPRCAGVAPMGEPYGEVAGRRIVAPDRAEVIDPVPGEVVRGELPPNASRLITLTTCHPEYSARQRLIVHGVLTTEYPKIAGRPQLRPPELEEG